MSFRDDMLSVLDDVRNILGPTDLDLTRHAVTIVLRTWSGGTKGLGTATDSIVIALPQKFKVVPLKLAEVSSSNGEYLVGDVRVMHVTPNSADLTVGYTTAQLKPAVTTNGVERVYKLAGPMHGEYSLVNLEAFKNFSWALVLRRTDVVPTQVP
jgi:hypothetical protein